MTPEEKAAKAAEEAKEQATAAEAQKKADEARIVAIGEKIDAKIEKMNELAKLSAKAEGEKVEENLKNEVNSLIKEYTDEHGKQLKSYEDAVEKMQEQLDGMDTELGKATKKLDSRKSAYESFKEQIESSESLKAFKEGNTDRASVEMKDVDLHNLNVKQDDMTQANTFTNDVVGATRVPGVIFDPDRNVHVRSFMPVGTTGLNSIEYTQETAIADNTANTAEGSGLPQSDVDLTLQTANVRKIGTYLIMSDEILEDMPTFLSYITARFGRKLRLAEDTQILYGDGTGQNLTGITIGAAAYVDEIADGNVNHFDILAYGIKQATVNEYFPNVVMVHPTDYVSMITTKDTQGNYLVPAIFSGMQVTVDGVPVVKSTAVTAGDFIIGDFRQGSQIWDRKAPTVEVTNTNEDNFVKGMNTVRVFERLALTNYRTNAFVYGDFASALALGSS